MNLILNYAAIGFRPYPELGEFVNVGMRISAPSRPSSGAPRRPVK